MRRLVVMMGVVAAAHVQSNPAPAQQAEAPRPGEVKANANANDPRLQEILALWEKRVASKSLDVTYTKIVTLPTPPFAAGSKKDRFGGRLVIDRPDRAVFEESKLVDKARKPYQRFLLTGQRLYRYRPNASSILEIPHGPVEEREKRANTVLARISRVFTPDYDRFLGSDQLPFLFDMNVADAHRRYKQMTLVRESPSTALIRLTEATNGGPATEIHAIFEVDKATWVPRRVVLYGPDQPTRDYSFTQIKRDGPIRDEAFQLIPIERWKSEQAEGPEPPAK